MSHITGYTQDAKGKWAAILDCGHSEPVRHRPPWINRAWILTPEGRADHIGRRYGCRQCESREGRDAA